MGKNARLQDVRKNKLAAPPKPVNIIKNISNAFPGASMRKRRGRRWRGWERGERETGRVGERVSGRKSEL
jgi:hypothetical protein